MKEVRPDSGGQLVESLVEWNQPRGYMQGFLDHKGFLVIAPMFNKTRLIAALGRYRQDAPNPALEDFQRLVDRLVPYKAKLSNPAWLARFHLSHRIADRFRQGRVFLAGDAAHIHSPAGGQGMNTGIQDAWNLGWKLAWALGVGGRGEVYSAQDAGLGRHAFPRKPSDGTPVQPLR